MKHDDVTGRTVDMPTSPPPTHRHTRAELLRELDGRLGRVEGQVRGLRRMLAEDRPCTDVLVQTSWVMHALDAVRVRLLADHLAAMTAPATDDPATETSAAAVERLLRLSR